MTKSTGGTKVKAGFYWRPAEWEIVTISGRQGGVLPGASDERFLRIPVLAMLVLAPIMGALFVVFLPFIGIALVLQHGIEALLRGVQRLAHGRNAARPVEH